MNLTLDSPVAMSSTKVLVWMVIPCFFSPRSTTFEMSASSVGSTRSSASNRSTSTPNLANAEAISAPEAPAPTTAIDDGSSWSAQASSVPITRPPNSAPGIARLTEPVASTTVLALTISEPMLTFPSPASAASPSISSIPFFLNSPLTPPVNVETTLSRRFITAG